MGGKPWATAGATAVTIIAVPNKMVLYEVMTAERPFRDDALVLLDYKRKPQAVTLRIEGFSVQGIASSLW